MVRRRPSGSPAAPPRPGRRRIGWRPVLWRHRHLLAAVLVAVGLASLWADLRPSAPPGRAVLVAARDLPAGTRLSSADLRTVRVEEAPAAAGADAGDFLGATLAVGVPAGLPLVPSLLAGTGVAALAPPGTVVAPVRVADPAVLTLVRPGDRVDLYLAPADTGGGAGVAELIVPGALVLGVPGGEEAGGGLLGGLKSTPDSTLLVVAVADDFANVLSGASGFSPLRVVISAS